MGRLSALVTVFKVGIVTVALASTLPCAVAEDAGGVAAPPPPAIAGDAAGGGAPPPPEVAGDVAGGGASEASPAHAKRDREKRRLGPGSTLAEWKVAGPNARSEVAVALARKRLPADAPKLEVATMAMEISGCLTKTAGDARFATWTVEPTATTCLTAPEKAPGPAPK